MGTRPSRNRNDAYDTSSVHYRRMLHPWRIALFLMVMLTLLVCAFIAGKNIQAPDTQALSNAQLSVPVTAAVERRIVDDGIKLDGLVVRGKSTNIVGDNSGNNVVTEVAVSVGDRVSPGTYLGSISGKPLFVLDDDIPLFRDLKLGDSGSDVLHLQSALRDMGFPAVSPTGDVDAVTLAAVRQIYAGDGLPTPGKAAKDTVFHWRHFSTIPRGAGTVIEVARVADAVSSESPLLTIQSTPNIIKARATVLQADELLEGTTVLITTPRVSFEGTVSAVGDFTTPEGPGESTPGKDITIMIPAEHQTSLSPHEPVSVTTITSAQKDLAVPLVAIQHDSGGTYVEVVREAAEEAKDEENPMAPVRVNVNIIAQAAGWVAVDPDGRLTEGNRVRVP